MAAYSFTAGADYRAYAATMTGFNGGSTDALMDIIASDSTTVLEGDGEGGAIGNISNLAATVVAATGTFYVRIRQFNTASLFGPIIPYDFYVRVLSGSPIPEMEPTDEVAPEAPRSNGSVSRAIGPATAENEGSVIAVNVGDTIVEIVGIDLECGAPEWNAIGGIGKFNGSFVMINGGRGPEKHYGR